MNPSSFASARLRLTMWDKFSEIFDAVAAGKRRILVRSANGVGKTTALAALCNWKLSTSPECIVLTTSSSDEQLRNNLWGEIRRQAAIGRLYEPDAITDTRIKLGEKRFMIGVSPQKPESAQGYHAASILIAVDEATGVRREIISSLIATATGDDVTIVMIYNPMSPSTFAYEAEQSGEWHVISIGAFDHPNVRTQRTVIPGAVTVRSTEDNLAVYSFPVEPEAENAFAFGGKWWFKTHEACRRILGVWYEGEDEGLFSKELIDRSLEVKPEQGLKVMGVDLAGGGADETIIARFDGNALLPFISLRTRDTQRVIAAIEKEYKNGYKLIAIDETTTIAQITPLLEARGIKANSVNFGATPLGEYTRPYRKLANTRIEMYYHLLEELKTGKIKLVNDRKLHEELLAIRQADSAERELYYLEPKDKLRQRLGRSPDRADATVLARYALLLEKRLKKHKINIGGKWA